MKKFLVFALAGLLSINLAQAKDYAKLQIKEMQHAQKYSTTNKFFENNAVQKNNETPTNIKDPKLLKFGNYKIISDNDFNSKLKSEETEYAKIEKYFDIKNQDTMYSRAKGEEFYKLYRIAERIIRSNNLDYLNWRIGIYRDSDNPNAYSTNNYVAISTSLFDTFSNNDDAIAMVIGHELGHALLGHEQRSMDTLSALKIMKQQINAGNKSLEMAYQYNKVQYLLDAKNMEFAADIEGAKLAMKAGYNLDNASEVISFLNTMAVPFIEALSDHPSGNERLKNFNENKKYFLDEWKDMGRYNYYNSEILKTKRSSDKKSVVIEAPEEKLNPNQYYRPENMDELYLRFAYKSYLNGEYKDSLKYFKKYFKEKPDNAASYLYASYAANEYYKLTKKKSYLEKAKEFAQQAKTLDPTNKYILEQIEDL